MIFSLRKEVPGGLALACLQDSKFTKMELHFLYEENYDPRGMDLVKTRINEVCDKPNGIKIKAEMVDFTIDTSWTDDDVEMQDGNMVGMLWGQVHCIGISYFQRNLF